MNNLHTLKICKNINKKLKTYGNINFINKEQLYLLVEYIRDQFNINIDEPFNVPKFYREHLQELVHYEFHNFNDPKIGGFLVKNKFPNKSYIVVNSRKEALATLFDLTHELMHFFIHPIDRKYYISSSLCDIDNFEWQANEGATELLVPYKKFIPVFVKNISKCSSRKDYLALLDFLADKFIVSTAVIEYRITGLKYEINQFENGIDINKIEILSKKSQEYKGIFIESYVDKFNKKTCIKSSIESLDEAFYSNFLNKLL